MDDLRAAGAITGADEFREFVFGKAAAEKRVERRQTRGPRLQGGRGLQAKTQMRKPLREELPQPDDVPRCTHRIALPLVGGGRKPSLFQSPINQKFWVVF